MRAEEPLVFAADTSVSKLLRLGNFSYTPLFYISVPSFFLRFLLQRLAASLSLCDKLFQAFFKVQLKESNNKWLFSEKVRCKQSLL